jgi:hypothetical protein
VKGITWTTLRTVGELSILSRASYLMLTTIVIARGVGRFAHQMRNLVDRHFPDADTIRVVLDNLSSHSGAAL